MVVQVSSYAKVPAYGWTYQRMTVAPTSFSVMNIKNQKLLISNLLHLMHSVSSLFKRRSYNLIRSLFFKRWSYNLIGSLFVKAIVIVEKKKFATTCKLT
jgi:hypothetical protein